MYKFLIFVLILVSTLLFLNHQYPYINLSEKLPQVLQIILILCLMVLGFFNRNIQLGFALKSIVLWLLLIFVILGSYSYRYQLKDFFLNILANISPASLYMSNDDKSISFYPSANGHFLIDIEVNKTAKVHFLLDTGASIITLSQKDAILVGINVDNLSYDIPINTANSISYAASIKLEEIRIKDIYIQDIRAFVVKTGLDTSLLGMNFLEQMNKYEVAKGKLTIWR